MATATEEELQAKIEFLEMKEKASSKIKEQVAILCTLSLADGQRICCFCLVVHFLLNSQEYAMVGFSEHA